MPVTPFHFGVGLLGKGFMPSRLSVLAFAVSQVVIDCETAYFLFVAPEWPFHRWAHTFLIGTPLGGAVGIAVWAVAALLRQRGFPVSRNPEWEFWPSLAGGVLGGATHPFLDGIMHEDVQPLRPFLPGNPFLGWLDLTQLHLLCLGAGAVGGILYLLKLRASLPRAGQDA